MSCSKQIPMYFDIVTAKNHSNEAPEENSEIVSTDLIIKIDQKVKLLATVEAWLNHFTC